jgi:hypothetical protein
VSRYCLLVTAHRHTAVPSAQSSAHSALPLEPCSRAASAVRRVRRGRGTWRLELGGLSRMARQSCEIGSWHIYVGECKCACLPPQQWTETRNVSTQSPGRKPSTPREPRFVGCTAPCTAVEEAVRSTPCCRSIFDGPLSLIVPPQCTITSRERSWPAQ